MGPTPGQIERDPTGRETRGGQRPTSDTMRCIHQAPVACSVSPLATQSQPFVVPSRNASTPGIGDREQGREGQWEHGQGECRRSRLGRLGPHLARQCGPIANGVGHDVEQHRVGPSAAGCDGDGLGQQRLVRVVRDVRPARSRAIERVPAADRHEGTPQRCACEVAPGGRHFEGLTQRRSRAQLRSQLVGEAGPRPPPVRPLAPLGPARWHRPVCAPPPSRYVPAAIAIGDGFDHGPRRRAARASAPARWRSARPGRRAPPRSWCASTPLEAGHHVRACRQQPLTAAVRIAHFDYFGDGTMSFVPAAEVDDNIDAATHMVRRGAHRPRRRRHQDHGLDPAKRVLRTVAVAGGEGAVMARVQGHDHVERFGTSDLADDQPIGP